MKIAIAHPDVGDLVNYTRDIYSDIFDFADLTFFDDPNRFVESVNSHVHMPYDKLFVALHFDRPFQGCGVAKSVSSGYKKVGSLYVLANDYEHFNVKNNYGLMTAEGVSILKYLSGLGARFVPDIDSGLEKLATELKSITLKSNSDSTPAPRAEI